MSGAITRGDIEGAIKGATGAPTSGLLHDYTPIIAEAIDHLINGQPEKENRIIKAKETRKADDTDK
jgi:hypothetical protein